MWQEINIRKSPQRLVKRRQLPAVFDQDNNADVRPLRQGLAHPAAGIADLVCNVCAELDSGHRMKKNANGKPPSVNGKASALWSVFPLLESQDANPLWRSNASIVGRRPRNASNDSIAGREPPLERISATSFAPIEGDTAVPSFSAASSKAL